MPRDDIDRKAIKQIVLGEYKYAVNALWEKPEIKDHFIEKLCREVGKECDELCAKSRPSLLRNCSPDGLKLFSEKSHIAELKERAPLFHSVLKASGKKADGSGDGPDQQCALSMAASVLLRSRNVHMSAQAYRVSLLLWQSGAKKQVSIPSPMYWDLISKRFSSKLCCSAMKKLPWIPEILLAVLHFGFHCVRSILGPTAP